jgi:hypothetical protein
MASRRDLKKNVNYIASELFAECLIQPMLFPEIDKAKADELMARVLTIQDEFINRISHTEPGKAKEYYKKFRTDFNQNVDAIVDAIGKLK